jgi:hypothetical protein
MDHRLQLHHLLHQPQLQMGEQGLLFYFFFDKISVNLLISLTPMLDVLNAPQKLSSLQGHGLGEVPLLSSTMGHNCTTNTSDN